MPQMSPMDWSNLILWFSIATNFMKSKSRLMITSSFNENISTNKIVLKTNNLKW